MRIGGEEGDARTYRDEMLVLNGVRNGVLENIDCHQSISFVGKVGIQSKKPIPVDRCGIWLEEAGADLAEEGEGTTRREKEEEEFALRAEEGNSLRFP